MIKQLTLNTALSFLAFILSSFTVNDKAHFRLAIYKEGTENQWTRVNEIVNLRGDGIQLKLNHNTYYTFKISDAGDPVNINIDFEIGKANNHSTFRINLGEIMKQQNSGAENYFVELSGAIISFKEQVIDQKTTYTLLVKTLSKDNTLN